MNNRTYLFSISVLILFTTACTNPRLLQDTKDKNEKLEKENKELKVRVANTDSTLESLNARLKSIEKNVKALIEVTTLYGERYRKEKKHYDNLNVLYEKVNAQYQELLRRSSDENERLKIELEDKKRELELKEKQLEQRESDLDKQKKEIEDLEKDVMERQKRVNELEALIARQDSVVNSLRKKLTDALIGFDDEDLTIEVRDGKVYVSLSEQLLFKSGSTTVDAKGKQAIKKLAEVLEKHEDIDILIEGHTDNVPIKGGNMKDNWDLSVLRATSIVRILTESGKLDPARVISAGRGEYHPVSTNDSSEGRKKNRRTEIILSPKLDELFKILDTK